MHYSILDKGISKEIQIEQGKTYNRYAANYAKVDGNKLPYLNLSSASEWTSITEALNGDDSIDSMNMDIKNKMSAYEREYNNILTDYSISFKLFSDSVSNVSADRTLSAADIKKNSDIVADLKTKNDRLLVLARLVVEDMNKLKDNDMSLNDSVDEKRDQLIDSIQQLKTEQTKINTVQIDEESLKGSIETTGLNSNSFYMHYLVLFIIAVTIVSFIFYVSVNPEANVMNVVFVVGALLLMYAALIKFNS